MPPDISIVIPTLNRRRELARTLRLLAAQRLPSHETIVVDNGSPDGTVEMLRRRFPRVRLVEAGRNLGAAARNLGAREARAPALLMLDDDSAPEPGAVLRGLARLRSEPRLAALGFRVLLADGSHEPGGAHNVFVGCGALLRREAFLAAGGYPEDFGYYAEEYALCYRLFAAGWRVRIFGDLVVHHRKAGFPARRADVFCRLAANNLTLAARFLPARLAAERSRELVRWYLNLGRLGGVRAEVAAAVQQARARLRRAPPKPEILHGAALETATSARELARGIDALRRSGRREVGFWRYTKDALSFARGCRRAGVEVRQLATDMLETASLSGMRVVAPGAARRDIPWLVPTFSPGLAANALMEMRRRGLEGLSLFGYETAGRNP